MPIAGFVRLRKHQFGRQADFNDKAPAVRAYPFKGVPDVDLAWTDPEVDTGSLDPVVAPYRGAPELTASLDAPAVAYNDLPLMFSAFFGPEAPNALVPPAGGAVWCWEASPALNEFEPFTYEFFDDVVTDAYQLGDGILESLEFSGPDGLGPVSASMGWRFGSVSSTGSTDSPVEGVVPTAGLDVATDDVIVYLKDMAIYIADTSAGLPQGQITDALHNFTLRFSQEIDQKRFANGDQAFDVDAYGRGSRSIELECTFAKTADTVGTGSESDHWMSDVAVNRYVRLAATSTAEIAQSGAHYHWYVVMPMRIYTRTEGDIGGNTTVVLTAHAFYDPDDLEYACQIEVQNTLEQEDLGS